MTSSAHSASASASASATDPPLTRFKLLILLVLCVNTSLTVFLSGLSRKDVPASDLYAPSTAVVMAEAIKLLLCSAALVYQEGFSLRAASRTFHREVIASPHEALKLLVPAAIDTFQNNILYYALTYLDSVTYQVRKIISLPNLNLYLKLETQS